MANTPVHIFAASGLGNLTVSFYTESSDTATATVTAVEATNRKTLYVATAVDVTAGEYYFVALTAGLAVAASGSIRLTNTTAICKGGEWSLAQLGNALHGGAAATLELKSVVVNNSAGVGLIITGSTDGVQIVGTNNGLNVNGGSVGVYVAGLTNGMNIVGEAAFTSVVINNSSGIGLSIIGTTYAVRLQGITSALYAYAVGSAVELDGETYGLRINGATDSGIYVTSESLSASTVLITGTTVALDIRSVAGAGDAIRLTPHSTGKAIDIAGPIGGSGAVTLYPAIVDAVYDETSAGHTDAGKAGAQIWTDIDAIVADTGTTLPAAISAVNLFIGASAVALDSIDTLGNLTIHRGDTFSVAITDLSDLSAYDKVYFTVKRKYNDADADAIIMMEATEGLMVLNGVAIAGTGTYSGCDLAVLAGTGGDITIELSAEVTAELEANETWVYDIQMIETDGSVHTLGYGKVTVNKDVTQAII